jgi:hypothetical protein
VLLPRTNAQQVEIADIVGGPREDLVVNTLARQVVFRGTATGYVRLLASRVDATEMELGDVTGDGRMDIVTFAGKRVQVVAQQPDGTFGLGPAYTAVVGYWPNADGLEVADVTDDGLDDAIVTIGGNSPGSLLNVFAQNDGGTFDDPVVYPSYDIPETVDAADLNGDGRADVVTLHGGWDEAGVYLQQLDGSLGGESLVGIPYASHYNPKGMALGDVNGDGAIDIVLADDNNGLVVLRQQ